MLTIVYHLHCLKNIKLQNYNYSNINLSSYLLVYIFQYKTFKQKAYNTLKSIIGECIILFQIRNSTIIIDIKNSTKLTLIN